jgi:hypothetical protein
MAIEMSLSRKRHSKRFVPFWIELLPAPAKYAQNDIVPFFLT